MNIKKFSMLWVLITVAAGILLRVWNLQAGYDASGLPVSGHITTWCFVVFSLLILITYLLYSLQLRGKESVTSITFIPKAAAAAVAGAILILAGSIAEVFLSTSNMIVAMVLLVFGICSGISLIIVAIGRLKNKEPNRIAELLPIIYLLLKLIINFKGWSIDPILLDYVIRMFAMICILLSFYYTAGFTFQIYAPVRSCFFSIAGAYFAGVATAEAILNGTITDLLFYLGSLLWLVPVVRFFISNAEKSV